MPNNKINNILSWNMQGYSDWAGKSVYLRDILNTGFYDVVLVQEAGKLLGSFCEVQPSSCPNVQVYRYMNTRRSSRAVNKISEYTALIFNWEKCSRCSLAIYVKGTPASYGIISLQEPDYRPLLWVATNYYVVGNIHLYPGSENIALKHLAEFDDKIRQMNVPYIIAGDFNIDAHNNPAVSQDQRFRYPACYTHLTIRNGIVQYASCLDYVFSPGITINSIEVIRELDYISDHSAIDFSFI